MMGGLHIEMAYLKAVGQWLEGSGWTDSLVAAGLVGSGTADSFLKAAHVTRTRRAYELAACALQMFLTQSYQGYLSDLPEREEPCSIESWCINHHLQVLVFCIRHGTHLALVCQVIARRKF